MPSFHYLPPGAEEQKTFALQFLGTLLCLALIGVLWYFNQDVGLRAILIGAGAGVLWMLGRAAWQLEYKAQRSQNAAIVVDDDGVLVTDAKNQKQRVLWEEITDLSVQGGRLSLTWNGGVLRVGARELENGMELVSEITRRYQQAKGETSNTWTPPTNFIPLDPK